MNSVDYDNTARTYLKHFKGLKTIPSVAARLVAMIDDDTSSLHDFEEVIKVDPTLVLRLLKLVNSAYFSLRTKINNISEAVAYIGVDNLRNMIILDALKNLFRGESDEEMFSRNRLWLHCSVTSICCQMISERIFVQKGEDAFLCGILHDIGLIVEDQVAPDSFSGILQIAEYLVSRLNYDVFPDIRRETSSPLLVHIKQNIMGYRAIVDDLPQEIHRAKDIYALEEE